jgi:hypothetical protein
MTQRPLFWHSRHNTTISYWLRLLSSNFPLICDVTHGHSCIERSVLNQPHYCPSEGSRGIGSADAEASYYVENWIKCATCISLIQKYRCKLCILCLFRLCAPSGKCCLLRCGVPHNARHCTVGNTGRTRTKIQPTQITTKCNPNLFTNFKVKTCQQMTSPLCVCLMKSVEVLKYADCI